MNIHFSSKTDLWSTPQGLFNQLNLQWGFELDVCATFSNAKCKKFYTVEDDGLAQIWGGVCWMNPPYGREIGKWLEKAVRSCEENAAIVVCLIPSRTDTKWWHSYVMRGDIEFIKGRLKFGNHKDSAPFPSAVVVFNPATIKNREEENATD